MGSVTFVESKSRLSQEKTDEAAGSLFLSKHFSQHYPLRYSDYRLHPTIEFLYTPTTRQFIRVIDNAADDHLTFHFPYKNLGHDAGNS